MAKYTAPSATEPSAAQAFAVPDGPFDVSMFDASATPIGPQSKSEGVGALGELGPRLADLQERLYAQSTQGARNALLLVLQGMDTSGKGGAINSVLGMVDPIGTHLAAFKRPTPEELAHDFLWRIEKQVPAPGYLGVFDRSHYEDVLVARVRNLVPKEVWSKRFSAINAFERRLAGRQVTLAKCFLHISHGEQQQRLLDRLSDPTKYWKYNPGDVDERALWADYQRAYSDALRKCSTVAAPWFIIPADRKWYRNWAIAMLLVQTLEKIDPRFPPADFDVEVEKRRVAES